MKKEFRYNFSGQGSWMQRGPRRAHLGVWTLSFKLEATLTPSSTDGATGPAEVKSEDQDHLELVMTPQDELGNTLTGPVPNNSSDLERR